MGFCLGLFDLAKKAQDEEYEKKLAGHVRSKVEEVRSSASRISMEGIWMTNIAYVLGYDSVRWNANSRVFENVNVSAPFVRNQKSHVNKILPTLQNRLARLCKNPPRYDVKPESNDTEDKEAARLGLEILTGLWEKLSLNQKRLALYMIVQQCGHAYVKISWDTTLGNIISNPFTGESDFEGDLRADVVSPFEIFPDPSAKSEEDALNSWIIQAKVRSLDYFRSHYPEKGHLVKEEDCWLLSLQYAQRANNINSRGPGGSGLSEAMKNSAIELVKYEARSKDYPNGRMIVVANGVVLEDKELPVGIIPFRRFDDVTIGGRYYPEAITTHLRPIQDQYNENVRRQAEYTRKMLSAKYKAARGTGLKQESMNNGSDEIVWYTPVPNAPNAGAPDAVQPPSVPAWAFTEEDRLIARFNDISGISEVSRGTLPSASIPAIGMQLLTEQDDTRLGVMTEQHEHAWAGIGTLILKYVEKFYVTPRKLKIAGKNLSYTVKEFAGADLKGNTDVIVIRGSTLPGSKVLRRQEILNAFSQGLLGDPADPAVREKVLGMLEFGDVAEIWQDYGLDMAQIKRGMDKMKQGIPVEVNDLDNHTLWIQELNRFRKSDRFEALDPIIQQLMIDNMEAHIEKIGEITNQIPEAPMPGENIVEADPGMGMPLESTPEEQMIGQDLALGEQGL